MLLAWRHSTSRLPAFHILLSLPFVALAFTTSPSPLAVLPPKAVCFVNLCLVTLGQPPISVLMLARLSHCLWPSVREKKSDINLNFLVRIFCGHSWPLRPDAQGSKSFSPPLGPQENALFGADVHDFRRGRPWPAKGCRKALYKKSLHLFLAPIIRCWILWPFFSRDLCRKAHVVGADLKGGSEDFHRKRGRIAENRALTDVNGHYFGVDGRFSAVNRR